MSEFPRPACEDDMVLEFIRSEVDSPRFGRHYPAEVKEGGAERARLIENADTSSEPDNASRRKLLAYRGYEARADLFAGFPSAVTWQWERLTPAELEKLKYANVSDTTVWTHLSSSTRLVSVAASNLEPRALDRLLANAEIPASVSTRMREIAALIRSVGARYERDQKLPRAIAVTDGHELVLLEGHVRMTALLLARAERPIEMLVGHCADMRRWQSF